MFSKKEKMLTFASMLVNIQDKVVSTQVFDRKFICDLSACKGACCVQGDSGAPLKYEEVDILENDLEHYLPYMRPEGIAEVEKAGVFYIDQDNEPVTALINGGECAFVYFDGDGTAKCAVEKAYLEGKTDFKKPISCHLYPIREKRFDTMTALDYHEWDICSPACACGDKLDVPVYKFLKEPITRAYGKDFFDEMELVAKEWAAREGN
jgi:hypothetical protein|tara:strand:+ start:23537 stop:24160 length:624 start_codon:yes stop_codon:yes gene_type:complete